MRSVPILLLGTLAVICSPRYIPAQPPVFVLGIFESEFGHIVGMRAGLGGDDTLSIALDVPFRNSCRSKEGGGIECCGVTTEGSFKPATNYALDPKLPGVKLQQAVLLSAFLSGRKVRVGGDGCIYDKPRITFVDIGDPI
jgi:hypothetical protein